jgi:pimeloyl-ACP methyl ester carboxylesterase
MSRPRSVVLLHGVWMRGFSLALLARRLARAGFAPRVVDYASVFGPPGRLERRLIELMRRERPVGVVGHSLGGVLATHLLDRHGDGLEVERLVCLGAPLRGSQTARRLAGPRLGRLLLGRHAEALCHGLERWQGAAALGSIAGTTGVGLGRILADLSGPNDGTVRVEETHLPGERDHCCIPTTHSGLLISARVAQQTIHFLRHGRFEEHRE